MFIMIKRAFKYIVSPLKCLEHPKAVLVLRNILGNKTCEITSDNRVIPSRNILYTQILLFVFTTNFLYYILWLEILTQLQRGIAYVAWSFHLFTMPAISILNLLSTLLYTKQNMQIIKTYMSIDTQIGIEKIPYSTTEVLKTQRNLILYSVLSIIILLSSHLYHLWSTSLGGFLQSTIILSHMYNAYKVMSQLYFMIITYHYKSKFEAINQAMENIYKNIEGDRKLLLKKYKSLKQIYNHLIEVCLFYGQKYSIQNLVLITSYITTFTIVAYTNWEICNNVLEGGAYEITEVVFTVILVVLKIFDLICLIQICHDTTQEVSCFHYSYLYMKCSKCYLSILIDIFANNYELSEIEHT